MTQTALPSINSAVNTRWLRQSRLRPAERARELEQWDALVEGLSNRHEIIRLLSSSLGKFVHTETTRRVQFEGTRVMVALELYRARNGMYPASLDQLVETLGERPKDPLHDLPFGYRLLDSDPRGGDYLLYSIGLDQADNDGSELDAAGQAEYGWSAALRNPDLRNVDLVINQPRRVYDE